MRDKLEASKYHVQSHLNSNSQQLQLTSLQLDARVLVIILNFDILYIEGYEVVFERCFENTNE